MHRGALTLVMASVLIVAPSAFATTVTIDTGTDLGPVNRDVFGSDFEFITANVPEVAPLVAGTPIVRFPGGDDGSRFLWTDTTTGTCATPRFDWDSFARLAAQQHIGVMLETNLLRGDPASSAAWVLDARARGLRVPWIGIGNEPWGSWDAGYRSSDQYAADVRAQATAIRAVAPDAKIVLEIGLSFDDSWNRSALHATADLVDAVDYHYYPNHETAPDPLAVAANADGIAPLVARLRAMIRDEAPARAGAIGIVLGEWDGASDPPPPGSTPVPGHAYVQWSMANALFYGSAIGEMLQNGVAAAMFYEVQGYRFGAVNGDACSPGNFAAVRPKALAMQLYRDHFGDRLVSTSVSGSPTFVSPGPTNWDGFAGTAPYVRAYASTADQGRTLHVMIVNRSPDTAMPLDLVLQGFVPDARGDTWQLAGDSILATNENVGGAPDAVHIVGSQIEVAGSRFSWVAPAHSVTALALTRRASTAATTSRTVVGEVTPHEPVHTASQASAGQGCSTRGGAGMRAALIVLAALALAMRMRSR